MPLSCSCIHFAEAQQACDSCRALRAFLSVLILATHVSVVARSGATLLSTRYVFLLYYHFHRLPVLQKEPSLCQHCKQYSFECTYFLPITETRFKKKKVEDNDKGDLSRRPPSTAYPESSAKRDINVFGMGKSAHLFIYYA